MTPIFGPLLGADDELEETGGLLDGAEELRNDEIDELDLIELTTELLIEDLLELDTLLDELPGTEEVTPPEVTIIPS